MKLTPIHPFPARMAPELACRSIEFVPAGGCVLDPMCGSGTVARAAVEAGLRFVGSDVDPLAVLMARVWTTPLEIRQLRVAAEELAQVARALPEGSVERPSDQETLQFISYWFAAPQQSELARLATALKRYDDPMKDALAVALSRIIVSKEMMASLARDTSHSRPHKVAESNDFDVYAGFLRSARQVAVRLEPNLIKGEANINLADARTLDSIDTDSVDLALTSPPYLNAIDYIRGHRLALVWLGYEMAPLREIRSSSIGAERTMSGTEAPCDISPFVTEHTGSCINDRHLGWVRRYAADMNSVLRQLRRVVKRSGQAVLVLGNSFLRGSKIDNARLIESLAMSVGFQLQDRCTREIPARRRYLPPPSGGTNALDARMRTETILTLTAP